MLVHVMEMLAHGHTLLLQTVPQVAPPGLTPDQRFQLAQERLQHTPITDVAVPIGFFIMVVLIFLIALRRKQELIREQAEVRRKLIDKFATGQELAAFLETQGGRQFLAELSQTPKNAWMSPTGGIVCTMLGLAFLGLTFKQGNFVVPGVLLLAIGVGLLISAAISHKLASKNGGSRSGMPSLPNV